MLYLQGGQPKKAVATAESLVRLQTSNAGFQNLLGMARGQAGDIPGSRSAFEHALKLDPRFLDPKLNLARVDVATAAYDAAASRLNGILQVNDKHVEALLEMGWLAERRAMLGDATRYLEKAADHCAPSDLRPGLALVTSMTAAGWALVGNYANLSEDKLNPYNMVNGCAKSGSPETATCPTSNVGSSWWLISAYNTSYGGGTNLDQGNDYFKIFAVAGHKSPEEDVPEPASLALVSVAFAAAGFARQRRRKNV